MYKKKKNKNVKKFRKRFNTRIIKSRLSYSVEEIAELLKVHQNTVRIWVKTGLKKIDAQQPYLVFGQDLIDFLKARLNSKKRSCATNELFCCKCQEPRLAMNNVVCIKSNNCRTNLMGICHICGTKINKTISPQKIDFYKNIFNVEVVQGEDLIECTNASATVKKKQEDKHGQM